MKQNFKDVGSYLKDSYIKFNNLAKRNPIISNLFVFGFFLISFLLVYMFLPVLSSPDDHYFHFRFAQGLLNNGFFNSFRHFQTIYFTGIAHGEHFLYYNFLFYLVLIPFTFLTPLYLGIKLFAITSVALIGTIFYIFFKKINIKCSFLWAVGFFAIIGLSSFWRLFLSRPFVFSPAIIILLLLALHKRKYFWIFFLSFIYLFWHTSTFLIPFAVVFIYFIALALYERKYEWKILFWAILGTLASVLVAFLIDHGFFINLRDNLFSVLSGVLNLSGKAVNISEGGEVYPKNLFDFLNQNLLLIVMFLLSVVIYVFIYFGERKYLSTLDSVLKKKRVVMLTLFLSSSVFFVAIQIISNRFADFFIFFSWIFIVLVLSEIFSYIEFTKPNLKKFSGCAIFICLIYVFLNNTLQLNNIFASNGSRPETLSKVGNYLSLNLKKGDIVFDLNWSWFPQLYYYAPDQYYAIGLEPKLTYLYSPKLYWLLVNVGNGYVCETEKCPDQVALRNKSFNRKDLFRKWTKEEGDKIANVVMTDFKSNYIVSSNDYGYLNNVLDNNKHFQKVVNSNNQYFVYKIIALPDDK